MASQKKKILSHENKRRLIINTIERLKTSQRSKDLKKINRTIQIYENDIVISITSSGYISNINY
jgi:hypothetical protein